MGEGAVRKGSKDSSWTLVCCVKNVFTIRRRGGRRLHVLEYRVHGAEMVSRGSYKVLLVSDASMYGYI